MTGMPRSNSCSLLHYSASGRAVFCAAVLLVCGSVGCRGSESPPLEGSWVGQPAHSASDEGEADLAASILGHFNFRIELTFKGSDVALKWVPVVGDPRTKRGSYTLRPDGGGYELTIQLVAEAEKTAAQPAETDPRPVRQYTLEFAEASRDSFYLWPRERHPNLGKMLFQRVD